MKEEIWLKERKTVLTGTDIPVLYGCGFQTQLQLWQYKRGLSPEIKPNIDMEAGRLLEPLILNELKRLVGKDVELHPDKRWRKREDIRLGATLDGMTPDLEIHEIKTTGRPFGKELPERVVLQVHTQRIVFNEAKAAWAWEYQLRKDEKAEVIFAAYKGWELPFYPERLKYHEVKKNQRKEDEIKAVATTWWVRHMLMGEPPEDK